MNRNQRFRLKLGFPVLNDIALTLEEKKGEDDVHHHKANFKHQISEVEGDDKESDINQKEKAEEITH